MGRGPEAYQPFDMAQPGRKAQHYNLLVQGGTEAVVLGPFDTPEKRIKAGRRTWRKEARPGHDNLFKLDVDEKGVPTVHEYVDELDADGGVMERNGGRPINRLRFTTEATRTSGMGSGDSSSCRSDQTGKRNESSRRALAFTRP